MQSELEATFLNIDKTAIREKLQLIGAECTSSERLMRRAIFDNKHLQQKRAWLRVRDEGTIIKLTLKQASYATDITRVKEIEVSVDDFENAKTMLLQMGFTEQRYQENYRESWKYNDVVIDIDTWPQIPSYIEIEADCEKRVKESARMLGLKYEEAVFGSADEIYKEYYGIDILEMKTLTFS